MATATPASPLLAARADMASARADSAPANPLAGFYEFVKAHLVVANNLVLGSATLVASLDFLAPRLSVLPRVVYSATAGLLLLMVLGAAAPRFVGRALSALGYAAKREGSDGVWRRPAWQFGVALLLGVSILGFASAAKAGGRGWIASEFPVAAALQDSVLGLRTEVADIKQGVAAANGKLDGLLADSGDPQRRLGALGYGFRPTGLEQAIVNGDARAAALFADAGYQDADPQALVDLIHGDAFHGDVADALDRRMFADPKACDHARLALSEFAPPREARLAAYMRLCDAGIGRELLAQAVARESAQPAPNAYYARLRAAHGWTLGELRKKLE